MSKRTIEMYYHPAKKEVKFYYDDHTPIKCSRLIDRQNHTFVLQEQGDGLFYDIANYALDGVEEINIRFVGTLADYEDFREMVRYANANSTDCRSFSCEQGGILPGMSEMYSDVEFFGKKSVDILRKQADNFRVYMKSDTGNEARRQYLDSFARSLDIRIENIEKKISSLSSTGINICFVGTYSSGKSSLINAIIGQRILPEADESKTAKFFIIRSPKNDEKPGIKFELSETATSVEWDGEKLCLDNNSGTHDFRRTIQECIDQNKSAHIHEQFYSVLDILNSDIEDCVGIKINVIYPLPIDSDTLEFTIYDTPGTGSNTYEHREILKTALEEQSHSIVVFVAGVAKMEGEGNSLLLEMLCGDGKNRIDMDRSLFVINRCDTTLRSKLGVYKNEKVRMLESDDNASSSGDNGYCIDLKDKKLFFVSASQAVAAKAFLGGWQNESDEEIWGGIKSYPFYQFNHYGQSDLATNRMINAANSALQNAANEYEAAYIKVGLFSLINAIREYGEKYAIATKLNALIKAVQDQLNGIKADVENAKLTCETDLDKLQHDLDVITEQLLGAISGGYEKRLPAKDGSRGYTIDEDAKKRLGVNDEIISEFQKATIEKIKVAVERKRKNINVQKLDIQAVIDILYLKINGYISEFNKKQKEDIGAKNKEYIEYISNAIDKSGLTEAGKKKLKEGLKSISEVSEVKLSIDVNGIIDKIKKHHQVLFFSKWRWFTINLNAFFKEVKRNIAIELESCTQECLEKYAKNLIKALSETRNCFEKNKNEYFLIIHTLNTSIESVKEVIEQLDSAANDLNQLVIKLDGLIWTPKEMRGN